LKILKFGLPKGSLEAATIELFRKSGWKIQTSGRSYFPSVDDPTLRCSLVRAQEMSRYVASGDLDAGITGKDWTMENGSKVVVAAELVYSKATAQPARWVLAVPQDSPIRQIEDLQGKKVATELVGFTQRYFSDRGVRAFVEFSWGATEAKVVNGLVDAIVELTETGSSLKAHGLRVVRDLLVTNPQLIACPEAWEEPWKRTKVEQIAIMLQGALKADKMVGLKMNVPNRELEAIVFMLPSITAPTVANLYGTDWFSVETVIAEEVVRELIPDLIRAGAIGIIEYPLNKVI
jgi:ATP phosphoribosyltransferase